MSLKIVQIERALNIKEQEQENDNANQKGQNIVDEIAENITNYVDDIKERLV